MTFEIRSRGSGSFVYSYSSHMLLSRNLQLRIFGYYDPEPPLPGSYKERVCFLAKTAFENGQDEVIDQLSNGQKQMQDAIEKEVVVPAIQRQSQLN